MCSRRELRLYCSRVARFALEGQVARHVVMEQRRRGGERIFSVAHARQVLVLDLYQPARVLRDVGRLGNDERDRLTDEAHATCSEDGPLRHARAHAILASKVEKADGLHVTRTHCVVAGEYHVHARTILRRFDADRHDAGMCSVGSQEMPIQLTGHAPVGRVFPATRQQAVVLEARHPRALHFKELFSHRFFPWLRFRFVHRRR